jgi:hypothetical protein
MAVAGIPIRSIMSFGKGGILRFYNATETAYVGFKVATVSTSVDYTLPTEPPAISGHVLKSTTTGVLSWGPQSGGGLSSDYLYEDVIQIDTADTTFTIFDIELPATSASLAIVEILGMDEANISRGIYASTFYINTHPSKSPRHQEVEDSHANQFTTNVLYAYVESAETNLQIKGVNTGGITSRWIAKIKIICVDSFV